MIMSRLRWVLLVVLLVVTVAACSDLAPAETPEQLDNTPGPPVLVDETVVENEVFRVEYPGGWRAVTSPTFSQPWVVFTPPEEDAVIVVAVNGEDTEVTPENAEGELRRDSWEVLLPGGWTITAVMRSPEGERRDVLLPVFDDVAASISAPQTIPTRPFPSETPRPSNTPRPTPTPTPFAAPTGRSL